jgi:hypothetical protein
MNATRNLLLRRRNLFTLGGARNNPPPLSKVIVTWAIAAWLVWAIVFIFDATLVVADETGSETHLGSVDDYLKSNPDFPNAHRILLAHRIPLLASQ